ncbi:hypothetical protein VTN77DRAFT_4228 [Rasamsonia byssochlamydoides]|uniref:uncharacterized protein n=1 Tax=Rasamsonia byssochlamydoides TaxID=89139 RepID=UPI0037440FAC
MAICITFGTQDFTSRLEGYENVRAYCQNCEHWDAYCISRWPWFTVCFVPVLPLSTHKYREVTCARCHFTQDLSIRPDIQPYTQPPPPGQGVPYGPPPQGPPIPLASGANNQGGPGPGGYTYK